MNLTVPTSLARPSRILGLLSPGLLLGLFGVACGAGGQSFDDGRDGVESKPSQETDRATNSTTDGVVTDVEGPGVDESDAQETSADATDSRAEQTDPGGTVDGSVSGTSPRALVDTTACLSRGDAGSLEALVSHECACPNTLRCALTAQGDRVLVDAWIEELEPPCPPACYFETAMCTVEFDEQAGTFEYGTEEAEFAVEALPPSGGIDEGVCLTLGTAPMLGVEAAPELCKYVDSLEAGEAIEPPAPPTVVDLSTGVELSTIQTAAACECCNWQWGWYYIPCGDSSEDGIVLTTDGMPYGTAAAERTPEMDDSFTSQEVTLGCQGSECEPTCVPGEASGLGTATGELRLLDEGFVSMNGEDFFARAEFRITSVR